VLNSIEIAIIAKSIIDAAAYPIKRIPYTYPYICTYVLHTLFYLSLVPSNSSIIPYCPSLKYSEKSCRDIIVQYTYWPWSGGYYVP
jgi:hypothetical protein